MNRQTTTSARQSSSSNSSPVRLQVLSKQVAFPSHRAVEYRWKRAEPSRCGCSMLRIDSLGIVANRSIVLDQKPRSPLPIRRLPRVRSRRAGQRTLQAVPLSPSSTPPSRPQQVVTPLPHPGWPGRPPSCPSQLVVKQVVTAASAYRWVELLSLRAFSFL